MTREEQLVFCKQCINRKMDMQSGLLCGLTNEKADFEESCDDFVKDESVKEEPIALTDYFVEGKLLPNQRRARNIITVFWINLFLTLIGIISGALQYDLIKRAMDGEFISEQEAVLNDLRESIIGFTQIAILIISVVLFLNWFRRSYANLHRLGIKGLSQRESMAVWSWFIPFVNLVQPFQIMKELFAQTQKWLSENVVGFKANSYGILLGFWWASWLFTNIIGNIAGRITWNAETTSDFQSATGINIISDSIDVIAILLVIQVIRKMSYMESMIQENVKD